MALLYLLALSPIKAVASPGHTKESNSGGKGCVTEILSPALSQLRARKARLQV